MRPARALIDLQALRHNYRLAHVLRLPDPLTQLSARLGDAVPSVPWCTETLTMLGSDNVGNPAVFEQLLGRKAVHYSQLVATAWR